MRASTTGSNGQCVNDGPIAVLCPCIWMSGVRGLQVGCDRSRSVGRRSVREPQRRPRLYKNSGHSSRRAGCPLWMHSPEKRAPHSHARSLWTATNAPGRPTHARLKTGPDRLFRTNPTGSAPPRTTANCYELTCLRTILKQVRLQMRLARETPARSVWAGLAFPQVNRGGGGI